MTAPLTDKPTVQQILTELAQEVQHLIPGGHQLRGGGRGRRIQTAITNATEQIETKIDQKTDEAHDDGYNLGYKIGGQQERERVEKLVGLLGDYMNGHVISEPALVDENGICMCSLCNKTQAALKELEAPDA